MHTFSHCCKPRMVLLVWWVVTSTCKQRASLLRILQFKSQTLTLICTAVLSSVWFEFNLSNSSPGHRTTFPLLSEIAACLCCHLTANYVSLSGTPHCAEQLFYVQQVHQYIRYSNCSKLKGLQYLHILQPTVAHQDSVAVLCDSAHVHGWCCSTSSQPRGSVFELLPADPTSRPQITLAAAIPLHYVPVISIA